MFPKKQVFLGYQFLLSWFRFQRWTWNRVEPCSWNSDNNDLPELAQPEEDEIQGHLVWVWISWGRKRVMTGGRIASSNIFLHIWHLIYHFDVNVLRSSGPQQCLLLCNPANRWKQSEIQRSDKFCYAVQRIQSCNLQSQIHKHCSNDVHLCINETRRMGTLKVEVPPVEMSTLESERNRTRKQ